MMLSKLVAQAVGWTVRYPTDHENHALSALGYELVDPDGHALRPKLPIFDTDILWSNAPDFESDPAACFAELDKLPVEATPRVVRMVTAKGKLVYEWKCGIIFVDVDRENIECMGETPAEAMCRALLAYYTP